MTPRKLSNAIANAVADEITAMRTEGLFSAYPPVATAVIANKKLPVFDIGALNTLQINASPLSRVSNPASRNSIEQEHGVLLLVTMRVHHDVALFGQLVDFVNDLDDLLSQRYLVVDDRAISWTGSDLNPLYDMEMAHESKVFRSLMQINYQAFIN